MGTINCVVDVYHGDDITDFHAVKADGIVGMIHKATQGLGEIDPRYESRKAIALEVGLLWGAYHFADGEDGVAQAKKFLSVVNPGPQDLLVLDLETNTAGKSMTLAGAEHFVEHIHQVTGRWPGLYTGSYMKDDLGNPSETLLANCWLWLSEYGPKPRLPAAWKNWTMWQYTDGQFGPEPHTVTGIGPCDRNMFNGDMTALRKLWGYTS